MSCLYYLYFLFLMVPHSLMATALGETNYIVKALNRKHRVRWWKIHVCENDTHLKWMIELFDNFVFAVCHIQMMKEQNVCTCLNFHSLPGFDESVCDVWHVKSFKIDDENKVLHCWQSTTLRGKSRGDLSYFFSNSHPCPYKSPLIIFCS